MLDCYTLVYSILIKTSKNTTISNCLLCTLVLHVLLFTYSHYVIPFITWEGCTIMTNSLFIHPTCLFWVFFSSLTIQYFLHLASTFGDSAGFLFLSLVHLGLFLILCNGVGTWNTSYSQSISSSNIDSLSMNLFCNWFLYLFCVPLLLFN